MAKSKYESHVKKRFDEILKWRSEGESFSVIARKLGISHDSFYGYKNNIPEFSEFLKKAEKKMYENIVTTAEDSLFKKLIDRTMVVETIRDIWKDGDGNVVKEHVSEKEKLVPADIAALIFALKNHKGEVWDKDEKEMNKVKIEKLKAEAKSLMEGGGLGASVEEKLRNYLGGEKE